MVVFLHYSGTFWLEPMSNRMKQEGVDTGKGPDGADGEELARRFRNGDGQAFGGLVGAYQSRIFNLAYRILNNYEDADELTQEIFVKVHGAIKDFEGRCKFGTWLHTIAVNMCRNRVRQTRRRTMFEVCSFDGPENAGGVPIESSTSTQDCPPAQLERAETLKLVERCIAELPVEFATVIVMRDVQGMSYEDVAASVGCSLGTVKSRIARARLAVKEKLRPHLSSG